MSLKKLGTFFVLLNLIVLNVLAQTLKNDCICPIIKIAELPVPIKSGELAVFTAQITGFKGTVEYQWSIDNGVILEGQGTPSIRVDTTDLAASTVTAAVEIKGEWCPTCEKTTASASVIIKEDPKPILLEKFVRPNCEYVLMQMDNFMSQLQNDPSTAGYVAVYGRRRDTSYAVREMKNWLRIRRFDQTRIVFATGSAEGSRAEIELWLVPPGAEPPEISFPTESAKPKPTERAKSNAAVQAPVEPAKPYIFATSFADDIEGCNVGFDLEAFAEIIKQSPKIRGNIVIREASAKSFRQAEKEILAELIKT